MHSILNHFICVGGHVCKSSWVCIHCSHRINTADIRRKLEHVLKVGTAVKSCTKAQEIPEEEMLSLKEDLAVMDADLAKKRSRSAAKKSAVASLNLPTRPRKRQASLTFDTQHKDFLDMGYARVMFTTAAKTGFMDSGFVVAFFLDNFHYVPPSRKVIYGPLLDAIYVDTQKKVETICNFKDADSLCTMAMDGWKAPTGAHIRDYMLVYDKVTFFWTTTNAGTTLPTGQAISEEALEVIKDVGGVRHRCCGHRHRRRRDYELGHQL